ncbi:MAG: type II toxin-antitoxin system HicA family toxin [Actinomycetota bacterium]
MGSIKRNDLIRYLRKLGFSGPYSGGKHQFMEKDNLTLRLLNPHKTDIGTGLFIRILKQAGIKKSDWINL